MRYNFGFDESNKMSVKEFRKYLLESNSKAHIDFDISNSDLYRARWSIRRFVREYELYIGKKIAGYAYVEAMDFWKVFV